MKSKSITIRPIEEPALELRQIIDKIVRKGDVKQQDIEKALNVSSGYLSRQLYAEKNGTAISKQLMRRLEVEYEFILTGRKTINMDQVELINRMADQITLLRSTVDVMMTELVTLLDSKNPSIKKRQLTKIAKEAAEEMMRSM